MKTENIELFVRAFEDFLDDCPSGDAEFHKKKEIKKQKEFLGDLVSDRYY